MYIPAAFRETRPDVLQGLIRAHSFATLVSQLNGELFATHLPLLLDDRRGPHGTLRGHMARANPHWQSFADGREVLVLFQGPHAYISPNWYTSAPAVPTWNYSAVHAYGVPSITDDWQQVRTLLEDTVRLYESAYPEQWSTARAGEDYIQKLGQAIVAFEIPISRLEGKRKLSQNRPTDIESAAAGLRTYGDATGQVVADAMLEVAASR